MGNKRKAGGASSGGNNNNSGAANAKGSKRAKPNHGAPAAANKGRKTSAGSTSRKPSGKGSSNANDKKNKRTTKSQEQSRVAATQADEDVEVDDDDIAFFVQNASSSSFLTQLDPTQLSKSTHPKSKDRVNDAKAGKPKLLRPPARRTTDASDDDDDADMPLAKLEARPRKAGWENQQRIDLTTKLPVKFMDGTVRQNKALIDDVEQAAAASAAKAEAEAAQEEAEDDDDVEDASDASDESDMEFEEIDAATAVRAAKATAPVPQKPLSDVDLRRQRDHRLAAKKIEIAQLCESILESPEDAFKKNKEHPQHFSKLQQLQALCRDPDATVKKLSMLSQLSVFLDILPDYRIRLNSDEKQNGRPLKKNVQQMQDYEASLLHAYQTFLKFCAQVVTDALRGKTLTQSLSEHDTRQLAMAEIATRCLAELLKAKYAFNFHLNLIVALVPIADAHFPALRKLACAAFESVFRADKSSVYALEIVKQVSSYVKQKEHRVKPDIIKTFLVMPLDVTMEQGEDARKRAKNDRKKRRRLQNDGDTIAVGLKEAEAVVDKSERQKTQADILHELVLVYFRILKQATYSTALPAVLEGLAKYAFLINLDIMIDLLKVLKAVLKADILPLSSALQAVLTGLRALQGPGQELMVDEKEFVDILYTLLRKFSEGDDITCFPVALQCVEAVFIRRKEIVVDRVAAFIKRLLLITLSLQPHQILAVLALIRSLFHRYSKLQQLLESDVDRVTSGEYRADVDDPDFTNPYSTALWELTLLTKHYHPVVASFALGTAEKGPSLPNEFPKALLDTYDVEQSGAFVPSVVAPPRNPLHAKMATDTKKKATKRKQRERKFYVRDPNLQDGGKTPSPFLQFCIAMDEPAAAANDATLDFAAARS